MLEICVGVILSCIKDSNIYYDILIFKNHVIYTRLLLAQGLVREGVKNLPAKFSRVLTLPPIDLSYRVGVILCGFIVYQRRRGHWAICYTSPQSL